MKKIISICLGLFFLFFLATTAFTQTHFCVPDSVVTLKNTAITIDVRANDSTSINCIYTTDYSLCCGSFNGPEHGTISILNWDSVSYTPNPDFVGIDNFVYSIYFETSATGACDSARVYVTVKDPNGTQTPTNQAIGIQMFPNPANDYLYFKENGSTNVSGLEIRVFSLLGKLVLQHSAQKTASISVKLDISELPSGIYVVQVDSGKLKYIQRLMIE